MKPTETWVNCQVDNAVLKTMVNLPLTSLSLFGTLPVSDAGLHELRNFRLTHLDLSLSNAITDGGLSELRGRYHRLILKL